MKGKKEVAILNKNSTKGFISLFSLFFDVFYYVVKYCLSFTFGGIILYYLPIKYWYISLLVTIVSIALFIPAYKKLQLMPINFQYKAFLFICKSLLLLAIITLFHPLYFIITQTHLIDLKYLLIACFVIVIFAFGICPRKDNRFSTGFRGNPPNARVKYVVCALIQLITVGTIYIGMMFSLSDSDKAKEKISANEIDHKNHNEHIASLDTIRDSIGINSFDTITNVNNVIENDSIVLPDSTDTIQIRKNIFKYIEDREYDSLEAIIKTNPKLLSLHDSSGVTPYEIIKEKSRRPLTGRHFRKILDIYNEHQGEKY